MRHFSKTCFLQATGLLCVLVFVSIHQSEATDKDIRCTTAEIQQIPQKQSSPAKLIRNNAKLKQTSGIKPSAVPAIRRLRNITPAHQKIEKALKEATDVIFVETPLTDAVEFLSDLHQIPIHIERHVLADEGIKQDVPIDLTIKGVQLQSVLNIILKPEGLTYAVEDEVLKITTEEAAEEKLHVSVYDVRKLTQAGMDADLLVEAVVSQTSAVWEAKSGTGGRITYLSGALTIYQTEKCHQKVMELLELLAQIADSQYK